MRSLESSIWERKILRFSVTVCIALTFLTFGIILLYTNTHTPFVFIKQLNAWRRKKTNLPINAIRIILTYISSQPTQFWQASLFLLMSTCWRFGPNWLSSGGYLDSSVGCLEALTCKPVAIPCLLQTLMLPWSQLNVIHVIQTYM